MIDPDDIREFADKQVMYCDDLLANPVDVPTFPPPEYWNGYRDAMIGLRGCVDVWVTKPT